MLDTTLINVSLPEFSAGAKKKTLVLLECRVKLVHEQPYAAFEELTFCPLNCNNYGCGMAEIELLSSFFKSG